jgi:hypothetical protein
VRKIHPVYLSEMSGTDACRAAATAVGEGEPTPQHGG